MLQIGREELIERASRLEADAPPPLEEIEALLTESVAVLLALNAEVLRTQRELEAALRERSPTASDLDIRRSEMLNECEGIRAVTRRLRCMHQIAVGHATPDAA